MTIEKTPGRGINKTGPGSIYSGSGNVNESIQAAVRSILAGAFGRGALLGLLSAGPSVYAHAAALEEVVVTAQKRTESLQDVPVSVAALSANKINGFKLSNPGDIAAQVPNLQNTSPAGDGFPIFSLRGVSMSDYSSNQSSPVAIYVDEIYKGSNAIQGIQMYDLDRIEVLRGPQGTLYGKNSTGGAVNFITRAPSFETGGNVSLGLGNYSRKEARGAFETPLVEDRLALRIAGTWTQQDGWFENVLPAFDDGNAIDEYGLRASLKWEPTDSLDLLLRISTSEQDAVNYGIQAFNISQDGIGAGLYGLYNLLGATTATDSHREGLGYDQFDSPQDTHRRTESDAVSLTVNWMFSDSLTLTSISSWDDGEYFVPEDTDGTVNEVVWVHGGGDAKQLTQDLRITSDFEGPFNFISGLYYAREEFSGPTTLGLWTDLDFNADGALDAQDCLDPFLVSEGQAPSASGAAVEATLNEFGLSLGDFAALGCQLGRDLEQERTSYAVYADTSYELDESWTLRLGLRYTEDETELKSYSARVLSNQGEPLFNTIPGDALDPFAVTAPQEISDEEVTGKIGIDYTFPSGNMLYAHFSRGYRSGGFNAQAYFSPEEVNSVDPEILDAFEVGFKSRLLDDTMELNGSAFFYTYENQQFLDINASTLAQNLVNIDESEISGLEVEMRYRPIDTLLVSAGLGWIDSEVKQGFLQGIDLSGNELLLAPSLNGNLSIEWDIFSSSYGALLLQLDSAWTDDQYFDIFNTDRISQDGYWLHNARLQFDSSNERWSAGLWVRNLSDEEYRTSIIDLQASYGFDYSHIGMPRSYGADVTFNF